MTISQLKELLKQSESETLDFKCEQYGFAGATDEQKGELLKDIIAIANTSKARDGHIVIGVEETNGRAKRVCGADTALKDADIQQFVKSRTNRQVLFLVEVVPYGKRKVTIITIRKDQERPIYLPTPFGRLKSNVVYVRRGSSTGETTPDELMNAARRQVLEDQERTKEERKARFWRDFKIFFPDLQRRVFFIEDATLGHVSDAMLQYRLPVEDARELLKQARELDLADGFLKDFGKALHQMREIDDYMQKGFEVYKENRANLRYTAQELRCLVAEMEKTYITINQPQ
jgi:hypothetical protein